MKLNKTTVRQEPEDSHLLFALLATWCKAYKRLESDVSKVNQNIWRQQSRETANSTYVRIDQGQTREWRVFSQKHQRFSSSSSQWQITGRPPVCRIRLIWTIFNSFTWSYSFPTSFKCRSESSKNTIPFLCCAINRQRGRSNFPSNSVSRSRWEDFFVFLIWPK